MKFLQETSYLDEVLMSLIKIESGPCVKSGRIVYALYDGAFPIVAATIYLRHLESNRQLASNTLASYAYALKSFFEFLKKNRVSFWEITLATIESYKRFYLNHRDEQGVYKIKRVTVRQYLLALKHFIGYWRGLKEDDPLFIDCTSNLDGKRRRDNRRGVLSHISWYSRVPNHLWQIKIPQQERHNKRRYKGLSREDSCAVMEVLNKAKHHTDIETMLYYRNRAIWAFMLMSMLRKGELVRIHIEDLNHRLGIVYLNDRPEDKWLGDLKTGPGEIFVAAANPYWNFVNSWLTEGRWIMEKTLKSQGKEDHGMLFCNRNGGPLTQPAINNLFRRIKKECQFPKNKPFFPHITRHTMACLMLGNGVGLSEVQAQLRHASIASTEIYAKVSTRQLRSSMELFWRGVPV